MGRPQQDFFGCPATPSLARPLRAAAARLREEAAGLARPGLTTRYSFLAPDTCAEESEPETVGLHDLPGELLRDLRRPSQFQRLEQAAPPGRHASILKDLAKASQLGLWGHLRPYSVFSNESCESLNSGAASPASIRTVESRSSHQLAAAAGLPSDSVSVPNLLEVAEGREDEEEEVLFDLQEGESKRSPELWAGGWAGVNRSDSQFTFQSYDCSSRNR
jgi:hypothetical protein